MIVVSIVGILAT
ncbi:MAG: hypothetical protein L0H94_15575, partial [Nitrospira sp.]|nr:hypothetical protein [Nitrospira sp.]